MSQDKSDDKSNVVTDDDKSRQLNELNSVTSGMSKLLQEVTNFPHRKPKGKKSKKNVTIAKHQKCDEICGTCPVKSDDDDEESDEESEERSE